LVSTNNISPVNRAIAEPLPYVIPAFVFFSKCAITLLSKFTTPLPAFGIIGINNSKAPTRALNHDGPCISGGF